jgi:sigma-B regulation protein RsbU (phosphoserine phosphatase)
MTLRTILQQKPETFDQLTDHWQQLTGGQLLVIDEAGQWIAGSRPRGHNRDNVLPEVWQEWLRQSKAVPQPITLEEEPVQIALLEIQGTPIGHLVAIGATPPDLFRYTAETLQALVAAEQSLQGMTDELISAWNQLDLVYHVTQSLASTSDLSSMLRSVLANVKRVFKAEEGFLILEQGDDLTQVSVGRDREDNRVPPSHRQVYHRLQSATHITLCNDAETIHEFWSNAPAELVNLLGMRLPIAAPAKAAIGLINKREHNFTAGDGKLLTAVAEQIAAIINNTILHQQVLARERMQRELEIAAEIQTSLLPHGLPEVPGVEFAVASLPATEVGGDFYDFIHLDEEYLGIVVGDVAGKGVPAAMLTSLARTILRVEAGYGHSPQRVIAQTNRALMQDLQRVEMFVTALVAYLNRNDLTLTYANAGHTPGLWWHADQNIFEPLAATTPPLGIEVTQVGEARTLQLSPGDFVIFYTDGVTEAMSPDDQIFGGHRLKEILLSHVGTAADGLVQSVLSAVRTFRKSTAWSDDLTIIAMRVTPSAALQRPQLEPAVEFAHLADLQVLESICQQVNQICRSLPDLPPPPAGDDFVYLVELAVSEICTNIVQHAYLRASGEIRGSLTLLDNGVQIDLYDDGTSFDPAAIPDPSSQLPSLNEGGYGLHIVRQIMDSVQYQAHTPKGNHWRLIKHIPRD